MPSKRRQLVTLSATGDLATTVRTLAGLLADEPDARYDVADGRIVVSAPPAKRASAGAAGDPRFAQPHGDNRDHHPTAEGT